VEFNTQVKAVKQGEVTLKNGDIYKAKSIIIAVEGNNHILNGLNLSINKEFVSTDCLYFELDKAPIKEPILILNSNEKALINNMCFVSNISKELAPKGKSLLSVTVLSQEVDFDQSDVQKELVEYFGDEAKKWNFLKRVTIPYALPTQDVVKFGRTNEEINPQEGIYLAGDYNLYGSLNAAMQTGREAAELAIKHLL
jgi:hypothetical protein